MAINQNEEFKRLKRRLDRTSIIQEKIEILEDLLTLEPSYPHLAMQKKKLARELEALKSVKSKIIRPYAWFHVPISRNSYLISLVGTDDDYIKMAGYHILGDDSVLGISLFQPLSRSIEYNDVPFQFVLTPPIYKGDFSNTPDKYKFLRKSNCITVITTGSDLQLIKDELHESGIKLYQKYGYQLPSRGNMPSVIVYPEQMSQDILTEIYSQLGIVRVYAMPENIPSKPPIIFNLSSSSETINVRMLARRLGRKFEANFRYANIWNYQGNVKAEGVLLDHVLEDGDIIKFYLR